MRLPITITIMITATIAIAIAIRTISKMKYCTHNSHPKMPNC